VAADFEFGVDVGQDETDPRGGMPRGATSSPAGRMMATVAPVRAF
jgi:hypothetical protein